MTWCWCWNDDLRLEPGFLRCWRSRCIQCKHIQDNDSFSHYVIYKPIDWSGFLWWKIAWHWWGGWWFCLAILQKIREGIPQLASHYVDNIQSDIADPGFVKGIRTASKFNREFILTKSTKRVFLVTKVMFDYKVVQQIEDLPQYPYENFYRDHIQGFVIAAVVFGSASQIQP